MDLVIGMAMAYVCTFRNPVEEADSNRWERLQVSVDLEFDYNRYGMFIYLTRSSGGGTWVSFDARTAHELFDLAIGSNGHTTTSLMLGNMKNQLLHDHSFRLLTTPVSLTRRISFHCKCLVFFHRFGAADK